MSGARPWLAALVAATCLLALTPQAALAGWRVAFILLGGIPIGAVVLLLIARLTGADWDAALLPISRAVPWLWLALVPLVVEQALFVAMPDHLRLWLAWPFFAFRGAAAIALYSSLARLLRQGRLSERGAALGLIGHGIAVTLLAGDWFLGLHPAQPFSAAGMVLAVVQMLAACSAACLFGHGPQNVRRDLGFLLIATCLGFAYLLFMDFLVVWYGNQPQRVGWYLTPHDMWAVRAPLGLALGLAAPILAIAIRQARGLAIAGAGALIGAALALAGEAALSLAGFALLAVAALAFGGSVWRERLA